MHLRRAQAPRGSAALPTLEWAVKPGPRGPIQTLVGSANARTRERRESKDCTRRRGSARRRLLPVLRTVPWKRAVPKATAPTPAGGSDRHSPAEDPAAITVNSRGIKGEGDALMPKKAQRQKRRKLLPVLRTAPRLLGPCPRLPRPHPEGFGPALPGRGPKAITVNSLHQWRKRAVMR